MRQGPIGNRFVSYREWAKPSLLRFSISLGITTMTFAICLVARQIGASGSSPWCLAISTSAITNANWRLNSFGAIADEMSTSLPTHAIQSLSAKASLSCLGANGKRMIADVCLHEGMAWARRARTHGVEPLQYLAWRFMALNSANGVLFCSTSAIANPYVRYDPSRRPDQLPLFLSTPTNRSRTFSCRPV